MSQPPQEPGLPDWANFGDEDPPTAEPAAPQTHPAPQWQQPTPPPGTSHQSAARATARPASSGLSFSDNANLHTNHRPRSRKPILLAALVATFFVTMVLLVVWASTGSTDHHKTPAADPAPSSSPAPTPTPPGPLCANRTDGAVTTGNDAGGSTSGPAVIKAFDYGYYILRSGVAARKVVAPTAAVNPANIIQSSIDQLPAETTYCLTITDRGAGTWGVVLTVYGPTGTAPEVIRQQIQTSTDPAGRYWINSIIGDPRP